MSSPGYKYDIGYLCCGTEIFSPGIQTETCPPLLWTPRAENSLCDGPMTPGLDDERNWQNPSVITAETVTNEC